MHAGSVLCDFDVAIHLRGIFHNSLHGHNLGLQLAAFLGTVISRMHIENSNMTKEIAKLVYTNGIWVGLIGTSTMQNTIIVSE
jgi:hypothetical protein